VAAQQLEMLRQAQTEGLMVRLVCGQGPTTADRIGVVAIDTGDSGFDDSKSVCIDGFVESLGLLGPKGKVAMPGVACVGFISAPPFHGAGNVVESVHFKPQNYQFYVLQHSVAFELFEAGLRDNIRVRAMALLDQPVAPDKAPADGLNKGSFLRMMSDQNLKPLPKDGEVVVVVDQPQDPAGLVFGVELLAPLSSASRPVWICIWRESLDEGPEKPYCSQGALPSNDLTPQTLRDLHIPYTAVWRGLACFNSGVYQFELDLPHPFKIAVDGRDLCLHAAKEGRLRFAHACLHGCHEVTVTIEGWTCKDDFVMDVYRLR
jgi:hypothetical protein